MKKTIFLLSFLLLALPAHAPNAQMLVASTWAQGVVAHGTAYQRPTANADHSGGLGCYAGTNVASSDMSGVYNSKSGAGPTGTANALTATYASEQIFEQRVFSSFQALTGSPSALTLSASVSGTGSGTRCIYYSTDGGSSWTTMGSISGVQGTLTVTITGATMSNVQVVGIAVSSTLTSTATINIFDIWTTETY